MCHSGVYCALLLQFGSTLVTYLIVLLQLKFTVGGPSQRPAWSCFHRLPEHTGLPHKNLRGITYSCGGEYARYVLLGCDTAMRYCRNANLQSIRDAGNRFFWNVCDFRPHYMTSHYRRGNIQNSRFSVIILELKTFSFAFKALYYIASNVIW